MARTMWWHKAVAQCAPLVQTPSQTHHLAYIGEQPSSTHFTAEGSEFPRRQALLARHVWIQGRPFASRISQHNLEWADVFQRRLVLVLPDLQNCRITASHCNCKLKIVVFIGLVDRARGQLSD